jgi:hypothetical protein
MKNTTINTALNIAMLILGAGSAGMAAAGLIGIIPPLTINTGEVAFVLYATAGMMLMALSDHGGRTSTKHGA